MANISILSRLINGAQRNVDLSANTLVVDVLKVGGGAGTDLTKAILDNLVALQNGSDFANGTNAHTHDGRYFTESELGSSGASSGSDLIGDDDTYSNFTPAAATVKGALSGIDAALAAAAGTAFSDAAFEVYDNVDNTKKINFQASAITTGQTRVITMADANVNLADVNNAILRDGSRSFTADQSMGGFKLTSLANGTAAADAINKAQLDAVQSLITNFEWQTSVKDKDLTAPPGSPSAGDRYLIGLDQAAAVATGAWAGRDGDIAEWDGSAWTFIEPTLGTYVSADDENDGLYLFGGSTWTKKYFEATTASTGLEKVGFDIRLASGSAGDGLGYSSGVLSVNVDNSTIEINADSLRVKAAGITESHLAASVAGDGLSGGAGASLAVNVDDSSVEINADALRVKAAGIQASHLNSNVADQSTITGAAGAALAVQRAPLVKRALVAGESFAANTMFAVRWALTGETAGRIYKADKDATSTNKYVAIGIALSTGAVSAGQNIDVVMLGEFTIGSSDTPFNATDVGLELFVGTSGAVILGSALAGTSGEAAYCIGVIQETSKIWVDFKNLRGIA